MKLVGWAECFASRRAVLHAAGVAVDGAAWRESRVAEGQEPRGRRRLLLPARQPQRAGRVRVQRAARGGHQPRARRRPAERGGRLGPLGRCQRTPPAALLARRQAAQMTFDHPPRFCHPRTDTLLNFSVPIGLHCAHVHTTCRLHTYSSSLPFNHFALAVRCKTADWKRKPSLHPVMSVLAGVDSRLIYLSISNIRTRSSLKLKYGNFSFSGFKPGLFLCTMQSFLVRCKQKFGTLCTRAKENMVAFKVVHKNFCNGPKWWFWVKCEKFRFLYKLCFISFNRSGKLVSVSVLLLRSIIYLSDAGCIWIMVIVTNTKMHVFGQWTSDKGASFFNKRHLRFSKIWFLLKLLDWGRYFQFFCSIGQLQEY